ncbi:MAG: hypothetical protein ACYC2Y_10475 [Armatimonadota bacterium]
MKRWVCYMLGVGSILPLVGFGGLLAHMRLHWYPAPWSLVIVPVLAWLKLVIWAIDIGIIVYFYFAQVNFQQAIKGTNPEKEA